jgi:hypothetical protein
MDDNPYVPVPYYAYFSRILETPHIALGTIALVGEVISGEATLNRLLAGQKAAGGYGRRWVEVADGLTACRDAYRKAWADYESAAPDRHRTEEAVRLHEAFREAAATVTALLERLQEDQAPPA